MPEAESQQIAHGFDAGRVYFVRFMFKRVSHLIQPQTIQTLNREALTPTPHASGGEDVCVSRSGDSNGKADTKIVGK
jgi:hypothetical protein